VIRVLIVDDHALVRSGLRLLLEAEEDVTVEDEAGNADEAVRKARLHKPDVVLLDVVMPGRSGLEAAPEIRQAAPKAQILVLSMQDDPSYVREAFASGASGYLLKEAADAELVAAVREVAAGRRYVHPTLGARLAAGKADGFRRQQVGIIVQDALTELIQRTSAVQAVLVAQVAGKLLFYCERSGLLAGAD